jgi:hypothetical protein
MAAVDGGEWRVLVSADEVGYAHFSLVVGVHHAAHKPVFLYSMTRAR